MDIDDLYSLNIGVNNTWTVYFLGFIEVGDSNHILGLQTEGDIRDECLLYNLERVKPVIQE